MTSSSAFTGNLSVTAAGRSLDERVRALEKKADLFRVELDALRSDKLRAVSELRTEFHSENSARKSAVEGVSAMLSAHVVEGIEYQWLALYWAVAGVVMSISDATWRFLGVWVEVATRATLR
jgi:hypothetical protein